VGSEFRCNVAQSNGGGCYFQSTHDHILFIDEDGYHEATNTHSIHSDNENSLDKFSQFNLTFNDTSLMVIQLDPLTTQYSYLRVFNHTTLNNSDLIYEGELSFQGDFFGITTPPLILYGDGMINFKLDSNRYQKAFLGFKLVPAYRNPIGKRNLFVYNEAESGDGGALYFFDNNKFGALINIDFHRNSATKGNAGALYFGTTNHGFVMANIKFIKNKCSDTGGAILFSIFNSGIQIYNVSFISNSGKYGGALSLSKQNGMDLLPRNNNFNVNESKFVDNIASMNGGAIYGEESSIIVIDHTDFVDNSAISGGGIHINGKSYVTLQRNISFVGNKASLIGGGIALINCFIKFDNLSYLNMTGNHATRGSAIYLDVVQKLLLDSTYLLFE